MTSEKSKKWVEAGIMFAMNVGSKVLCPECELSYLEARDIMYEANPQKFERLISCPKCNAKNYLLLNKKM